MACHRSPWTQVNSRRLLLFLFVAASAIGCSPRIQLERQPPLRGEVHARAHIDVPAVLVSINTQLNGGDVATSDAFRSRFTDKLREAGIFSAVLSSPDPGTRPAELRLAARESLDPHTTAAFWKGFAIGATLFILSPAIPFDVDYALDLSLEVAWPDGETSHYESGASGTLSANYFQVFDQSNVVKMTGEVSGAALNGLVNQLADDAPRHASVSTTQPVSPGEEPRGAGHEGAQQDLERRLRTLERMYDEGLISKDEYRSKRRALLDQM